eukprot:scaffold15130_cov63-Phaeocystis_antarctica.AAC.3
MARTFSGTAEDIDTLELWLAWGCSVGIATLNTIWFVAADPAHRPKHIELELLSDAERYSTFAVRWSVRRSACNPLSFGPSSRSWARTRWRCLGRARFALPTRTTGRR